MVDIEKTIAENNQKCYLFEKSILISLENTSKVMWVVKYSHKLFILLMIPN